MDTSVNFALSENARFWRAIGRLEGAVTVLLESQRNPTEGHLECETVFSADLRKLNRRLDQLFYLVVGGGTVLMATILVVQCI